ncbi:MAG: winged helix-turn-helix domain-containing protein [Halorientalis sp.]
MTDDSQPQAGSTPPWTENPLGRRCATVTPSIDTVFELLANVDRRRICLYLMNRDDGVVTVEEIADALATEECEYERFAIDLHHRHLPKLSAAGLIEYDPRSNTARYWGQPTVEKWAEHVQAVDGQLERPAP